MENRPTYETVIDKTGWGLYYKFLLSLCCVCNISLSFVFMSIFVVLPFSACNMKLSNSQLLTTNGIFMIGCGLGNYTIGSIFDWFGRKNPITMLLVIAFCGCFSAGFATGSTMLQLCIFVVGLSVTSGRIGLRIYLVENMPSKYRGSASVLLDVFWTLGCLLSLGASLAYMSSLAIYSADLRVASWRMFFALSGVLCMISSCSTALLFGSPRFLLMKKRFVEAKEILRHMYAINCSEHADNWPTAPEIEIATLIQPQVFEEDRTPTSCWETIIRILVRVKILTWILFGRKYIRNSILIFLLKIVLFPGTFMIVVWTSVLMLKLEDVPKSKNQYISKNCTIESEDALFIKTNGTEDVCEFDVDTSLIYVSSGFLATALLAQICLYYIIDWSGRKVPLFFGLSLCSLCSAISNLEMNLDFRITICIFFIFCYAVSESCVNVIVTETYPTRIRGTVSGFTSLVPTLLLSVLCMVMCLPCFTCFIAYGILLFVGLVLSTCVTDLSKKSMIE